MKELQILNDIIQVIKNFPKRTRYYIGMIDLYIKDRWKHTVQNVCEEDKKLLLNDYIVKNFFNTSRIKGVIIEEVKNIRI